MKKYLLFLFYLVLSFGVFAQATVTPSHRTICGTLPTAYKPLSDIIISEGLATDFAVGAGVTIVISAPTNWQFTTTGATVTYLTGRNISAATINSVTNSNTFTITLTVGATTLFDAITISGVTVRANTGAASGNMTRTGGTATINGNASGGGVNHGTLTYTATCVAEEIAGNICSAPVIPDTYCSSGNVNDNTSAVSPFMNGTFAISGCGNNRQFEVYYQFVATATDYEVVGQAGTIGSNAEFTVLRNSTSCPTGTTWTFVDATCPGWGTVGTLTGLTIGQTYFLAIDHSGGSASCGTFDFCITPVPVGPAISGTGKTCATAININNSGGLPFSDTHTMVTGVAGDGNDWINSCMDPFYPHPTYNFGGGLDMFYSYTVTGPTYITYELTNCTANSYAVVSVLRACPPTSTTAANITPTTGNCVTAGNFGATDGTHSMATSIGVIGATSTSSRCTPIYLPAAGTYFFVVDNWPTPNSWTYTLNISDMGRASNDGCTGVTNLVMGTTQSGNNAGCNYSYGPDDPNSGLMCATSTENTAWFQFTATTSTVTFDFTNVSGQLQYGCFSGPCGGPYTKAGQNTTTNAAGINRSNANDPCDTTSNNSTFTITGLTPGTSYWLAVDGNGGTPSRWDITGVAILATEILDFKGHSTKDGVKLIWTSSNETGLDYYAIEKAYDGKSFKEIDQVNAKEVNNGFAAYSYLDDKEQEGTRAYYRLKMVDQKGEVTYSNIIIVEYPGAKFEIMETTPVPFSKNLDVVYSLDNKDVVDIKLYDVNGRKVVETTQAGKLGTNTAQLSTEKLSSGIYYLIITRLNGDKQIYKKIVKE